jgi:hypothetical protein
VRAALYTFVIFIKPSEHPDNDGFHARNDPLLLAVEQAAGFIARSGYPDEPGPDPWGELVWPQFYTEHGDGWPPATLSLWEDLESMLAFAYFGLHAEVLSHGREWFQKPKWPPYAVWWVDDGYSPHLSEHLHHTPPVPESRQHFGIWQFQAAEKGSGQQFILGK